MFKIKPRTMIRDGKEVARVSWMKIGQIYEVLDTLKWRDKESGQIQTLFLVGDPDTGDLIWLRWEGVLFAGKNEFEEKNKPAFQEFIDDKGAET